MVTAKREPAQEETQTQQNTTLGAAKLGFFLGRLPFGGDHFLTTFLAYVLGRPKTIILQFLGFGQSRGHGLYNNEPICTTLRFLAHAAFLAFQYVDISS